MSKFDSEKAKKAVVERWGGKEDPQKPQCFTYKVSDSPGSEIEESGVVEEEEYPEGFDGNVARRVARFPSLAGWARIPGVWSGRYAHQIKEVAQSE